MNTYDVELNRDDGTVGRCRVRATSGYRAAELAHHTPGFATATYAVYRHRRLGGRRLEGLYRIPAGGGDDGSAGVREPRRPLPGPGHLHAAADLPHD